MLQEEALQEENGCDDKVSGAFDWYVLAIFGFVLTRGRRNQRIGKLQNNPSHVSTRRGPKLWVHQSQCRFLLISSQLVVTTEEKRQMN